MTDPHRPRLHLTAETGWLNDAYGVTWWEGRYHLFHQYVPGSTAWSTHCHWREVDGADLVRWEHPRVALTPTTAAHGCWSGAVVLDGGRPTLLISDVDDRNWGIARILLAQATADGGWQVEETPVLTGPPPGLGVVQFRDPVVTGGPGGWEMLVGAELPDSVGAVLAYRSTDLRDWRYAGVLASRPTAEVDPVWTGSMWECPQLFALDGAAVLVVSVWGAGETHHVAVAVGDRTPTSFVARRWSRLWYGDANYATTTFLDTAGRRCAVSWSREPDPVVDRDWAGALSLPVVLSCVGDRVHAVPHPDVDTLRGDLLHDGAAGTVTVLAQADVTVVAVIAPGSSLEVGLDHGAGPVLTLSVGHDEVLMRRPGRPVERMPLWATGEVSLRLLIDASVVEIFVAGAAAGLRIEPITGAGSLTVGGSADVRRVTVHAMAT